MSEGERVNALLALAQVTAKLRAGYYKTEPTFCFCGADNDMDISHNDRYGINHNMVVCLECGIIRANPRMTDESYAEFYEKEYRHIYGDSTNKGEVFLKHIQGGMSLMSFCEYYDLKRDVVVDIGCNMGAWLVPFQDEGSEVWGVDYDKASVDFGKSHGLNLIHGGIEKLIDKGVKADIVIMNHVLEHISDIPGMLEKIKLILAEDGVLFIGLPGLYFWHDANELVQNAHLWQFNADTFEYMMQCCGWDSWYLDDHIWSAWKPEDSKRDKEKRPVNTLKSIERFLNGDLSHMPKVRTMIKFPLKDRKKNLEDALSMRIPDIRELENTAEGDAIIVCGGPGVNGYEDTIRQMQKNGAKVFTIERMYDWCHDNGITPDYAVILDACDDVKDGLQNLKGGTKWLISAIAQKATFEALKDYDSYVFVTEQKGINHAQAWYNNGYEKVRIINSGGSVSLASMALAMSIGFRKLHFFGFDCHITNGTYAKGIKGEGVVRDAFEVDVDGRIFLTTSPFMSFMQQFFILYMSGKNQGLLDEVLVYGDSMVKHAAKIDIDGDKTLDQEKG